MIRTLATLVLLAGAACGSGWDEADLRVKFGVSTTFGVTEFIQMPQSVDNMTAKGWVEVEPPAIPSCYSNAITFYCEPNDHTISIGLDDTGYPAAVIMAIDQDYMSDPAYDLEDVGCYNWTTTFTNGTVKNYWAIPLFLASCDFLATDSSERIANRDSTTLLQDDNIYVSGFNQELYNISTNTDYITASTSMFKKQACIPFMGHHYYWNMTTSLECSSSTIFPLFPLIYDNQLVGVGFMVFAKFNAERTYFEAPSQSAVELIVNSGPDCLYELAGDPGAITMHTYFIPTPRTMSCVVEG